MVFFLLIHNKFNFFSKFVLIALLQYWGVWKILHYLSLNLLNIAAKNTHFLQVKKEQCQEQKTVHFDFLSIEAANILLVLRYSSASSGSCWVNRCLLRFPFRFRCCPQSSHSKGFSLECVFTWFHKLLLHLNTFGHLLHLYVPTALWVFLCVESALDQEKVFLHILHEKAPLPDLAFLV